MPRYIFEEAVIYSVPADDLEEAERLMGEEDASNYEIHREMEYKKTEGN